MKFSCVCLAFLTTWMTTPSLAEEADSVHTKYDGQWSVELVCADTQDKTGLVKGYEYKFFVVIVGGTVRGQYGAKGSPASVTFSGLVETDGTLELRAVGNTGRSDYSVGKVERGTEYSYSLSGTLEGNKGQAKRRELRMCTALFAKS